MPTCRGRNLGPRGMHDVGVDGAEDAEAVKDSAALGSVISANEAAAGKVGEGWDAGEEQ